MKIDADTLRDLAWQPFLVIPCANPHCEHRVVYRGQFCASCEAIQLAERARIQQQQKAGSR